VTQGPPLSGYGAALFPFQLVGLGVLFAVLPLAAGGREADVFASDWLVALPSAGAVLPTNGHVVLEGTGAWRERLLGLEKEAPRLEAPGDSIALKIRILDSSSEDRWVSVALEPERKLKLGSRYQLTVTDRGGRQVARQQVPEATGSRYLKASELAWVAGAGDDKAAPTWTELPYQAVAFRPTPSAVPVDNFICLARGGVVDLAVRVAVSDASAVHVRVEIRDKRGRLMAVRRLPLIEGHIVLLGLCPLACPTIEADHTYFLKLTAIDAAGNVSDAADTIPIRWKLHL
jgi:hypothetical protein